MHFLTRVFFIAIIAILAAGIYLIFQTPKEDLTKKISQRLEEQKGIADLYLKEVTLSESLAGIKYWEIDAVTSRVDKEKGETLLRQIKGTFFEKNAPAVKFTATRALFDMKQRSLLIDKPEGESVRSGKDKYSFSAKTLYWDMPSKKIRLKENVKYRQNRIAIDSQELISDIGLKKAEIKGSPRMVILEGEGINRTTITAGSFLVDGIQNTITAQDKVVIVQAPIVINCQKGIYDRTKALFTLQGEVTIERGKEKLQGDRASINLQNGAVEIAGATKAIISEEEVSREIK